MADLQALTFDQIVGMMAGDVLSHATADGRLTDVVEGSILLTLYEGTAAPIEELMYRYHVDLPIRYYLDQAEGVALERLVKNFTFDQVKKTPAAKASGQLRYHGEDAATIPANSRWITPQGLVVLASELVQIEVGTTSVLGLAAPEEAGSHGNLLAGVQLTPVEPITGVTHAVVEQRWTGGTNLTSDADLRQAVIDFLDSLVRGTKGSIVRGCRVSGYGRVYLSEPLGGRVVVWVDDAEDANAAKLLACADELDTNWKAAGIIIYLFHRPEHVFDIEAEVFNDGTVPQETLEANIESAWRSYVDTGKRMGDWLTRLELMEVASKVAGYNGVNIFSPGNDFRIKPSLNRYNTKFGVGELYPYEKLKIGTITWRAD
jgi:hypothetical protein